MPGRRLGPPGIEKFDGRAAREAFRTGKVALLIDRAERAAPGRAGNADRGRPAAGLGSRLRAAAQAMGNALDTRTHPATCPQGGGWLVGVRRGLSGSRLDAALDLAKYLAGSREVQPHRVPSDLLHAARPGSAR